MSNLGSDVVYAAIKKMSYNTGYEAGYDYADGIGVGIEAVSEDVTSSMNDVVASVTAAASDALSSGAGHSIGHNFASGIANGIRAGMSSITVAARVAAQTAVSAAKTTLAIHSPSAVARDEIGKQYTMGIVEGILDKLSSVRSAVSGVTGALMVDRQSPTFTASNGAEYIARSTANAAQQNAQSSGGTDMGAVAGIVSNALQKVRIIMDGREVGYAVAPTVNEIIADEASKRRYAF